MPNGVTRSMFKWLRAISVGTAVLFMSVGSASAVTTVSANLDTDGTLTVDGNVLLGDGDGGDLITLDNGEGSILMDGFGLVDLNSNDMTIDALGLFDIDSVGSVSIDSTTSGITLTSGEGDISINSSNNVNLVPTGGIVNITGAATTSGTLTANGIFDANGVVTLGDDGDAITVLSTGWDVTAGGAASFLSVSGDGSALTSIGDAALSANVSHLNVAETIAADWVNTANPWLDAEVADTLTIGAASTVADGALSVQVAHLDVAETITANWVNTANPWADNEVTDALTISGGTVNGSVIGGVTPAAGSFTTLSANSQITSTLATGTAPLVVSSTTPVANLTVSNHPKMQACGTTTTCTATATTNGQIVFGSVALTGGVATVTGFSPAFTSTASFVCTVTEATAAGATQAFVTNATSSSITITGTATDTYNYICVGN